jgi:hypothetical protein
MIVKKALPYLIIAVFLLLQASSIGQGVRGRVIDQDGNPLSFTTIFIPETGSGSVTNINGTYEIKLSPGTYNLNYQYLGYASAAKKVTVANEWITLDIVMAKQAYTLEAAEIDGGKEDPAYKIMRKAIAKSSFHRQQVEKYTCTVYLKGGGRLVDYPWFMRKTMEEEGIDTSATFVQESVTEVTYERPGKYTENVISIRSSGDDQNSNPMNYINGSFYEDKVAGVVSPLSRKAFGYYRFEYLNTFVDGDYNINKIKVTPRIDDEEFVSGYLYIVEDLWSIHSVDFKIHPQGINIRIEQNYAPIKPDVWLPISHHFQGDGKLFGFEFEFEYLATVSKYDVEINPDLDTEFEVLDIKTEQEEIAIAEEKKKPVSATEKKLLNGEEVSTKDLRKLMREYAKEERKEQDEPDVIFERKINIDTLAYKQDSLYWQEVRPIPLTQSEVKGYALQDSLTAEYAKKAEGDTLTGKKGFQIQDLILGGGYDLGNGNYININNPLLSIRYNTVDGWNGEYGLKYYKRFENKNRLEIMPLFRYAVSRDKGFGKVTTGYTYGQGLKQGKVSLSGGSYYSQFNAQDAILPFTNTFTSLLAQNNFMKVYDRDFVEANWKQNVSAKWKVTAAAAYSRRTETRNTTSQVWFPADNKNYGSNRPENIELGSTAFGQSDAFKVNLTTTWLPFAYAYKRNDQYYSVDKQPTFTLKYEKAIPGIADATMDYDRLSLEVKYSMTLGLLGTLNLRTEGGTFLNNDRMDFMDYAHFMGNQTIFTRFDQLKGYAIAPYHLYSTNDEYLSTYVNFELRRFVFSQFQMLRLTGLTENINVNHLITPSVDNYTEVSYSLSNIFRLFRIDVTGAFVDGKYEDFRVQVGITSNLFSTE